MLTEGPVCVASVPSAGPTVVSFNVNSTPLWWPLRIMEEVGINKHPHKSEVSGKKAKCPEREQWEWLILGKWDACCLAFVRAKTITLCLCRNVSWWLLVWTRVSSKLDRSSSNHHVFWKAGGGSFFVSLNWFCVSQERKEMKQTISIVPI